MSKRRTLRVFNPATNLSVAPTRSSGELTPGAVGADDRLRPSDGFRDLGFVRQVALADGYTGLGG